MRLKSSFKYSALVVLSVATSGCAWLGPKEVSASHLLDVNQVDRQRSQQGVEPLKGPLTLNEALARAIKYNLERRTRMLEQALAMQQLGVSKIEMLPQLMASAGYSARDTARFTYGSSSYPSEQPTFENASTSSDRQHSAGGVGLSWNLLDFGLGYYSAKQEADRFLISHERRRKATHLLMQDVRVAYWRAASAQILQSDVQKTIQLAEEALSDSRKAEAERIRNPLEPLRFQRQLLENVRLLESINQELSSAQIELATLINVPIQQKIILADASNFTLQDPLSGVSLDLLETLALQNNADLREQHYNASIARSETKRTMTRLFPSLSFNYEYKYDSDKYLLQNKWNEAGVQISFNLMNLFTGSSQLKLAEAGVELADHRRMTMQISVITQVHLAKLNTLNAASQYVRADAIYEADKKIAEIMRMRGSVQAQSKLDMVSTDTSSILSLLRRYQALAQVQVAQAKMLATVGIDPVASDTERLSLDELTKVLSASHAMPIALDGKKTQP